MKGRIPKAERIYLQGHDLSDCASYQDCGVGVIESESLSQSHRVRFIDPESRRPDQQIQILGSITYDSRCTDDIRNRTATAKTAFWKSEEYINKSKEKNCH